ncbi:hypothetical protein HPIN_07295 [Helicobacter pylori India7]|uniref:Uncharacterized protein n=1 Tax=Helicobacter pylori (strain India7) TaxID=907238 RepID=E8QDZ1_HELP7|nr:hypothetical protein HPIN_05055 [Helicobacter pylori India7]ADU80647.1 hypothetical protein HPIN_07295 [Helicobacter pylori India7]
MANWLIFQYRLWSVMGGRIGLSELADGSASLRA